MRQNWGNTQNPYSVTSASYDDLNDIILYPKNILVSPYKLDCEEITFIACAQDANHPEEHFGVAVSTEGNTDASDFTIVWETDMDAKGAGSWHYYSVDLRDYQGQDIYVAIIHFSSANHFMLNVDDITLYRTYDQVNENDGTQLTVYPNPATDRLNVMSEEAVGQYEIYDMTGALLLSEEAGISKFSIDVQALPAGVYLLTLRTKDVVTTKRFIK